MLLIDGYNLLFVHSGNKIESEDLHQVRDELLYDIAKYCEICSIRAKVIFDNTKGAPVYGSPGRYRLGDVDIRYTSQELIADEEILEILSGTKDRTAYTVISSDRAIADVARKRQFRVMDSPTFNKEMRLKLQDAEGGTGEAKEKSQGISSGEADSWLREFGLEDEEIQ